MFWRKAFNALLEWKEKYSDKYAAMLEGARRVGKSTIAEEFAKTNFKTYGNLEKIPFRTFSRFLRVASRYNSATYNIAFSKLSLKTEVFRDSHI